MWPSPEVATLEVDLARSRLHVPVRTAPETDQEPHFPRALGVPALQLEELRPDHHLREFDEGPDGTLQMHIVDDFGKHRDRSHGLITGTIARETYSIHPDDPLSAHAAAHWTEELERDGWSVRTETRSEMRADETHFHLKASLEAHHNDKLVFEKSWDESIERRLC